MLFMTLNFTKSVIISLPFFFLCFSHLIEKLISPNSQKSNILLTENDNLKHETIFVFVNLQTMIIEYLVQSHQWKNMCTFKHSQVV